MTQFEDSRDTSYSADSEWAVPLLNYDILIYSMLFLTDCIQYDLLPMMQTCRVLYQAGIPLLLRRVYLHLDWCSSPNDLSQMLNSFSLFISADPTRRSLLVRELSIAIEQRRNIDSQSIRAFAQVLKQFHNLIALSVSDVEYWFSLDSSLEDAVCALPNLCAVNFDSPNDDLEINMTATARVLNRLTAPVRLLNLCCPSPSAQDLFGILRNLAPTLEYLTIRNLTLTSNDIVFPRLKAVALHGILGEDVSESIPPLIASAPNLQTLELYDPGFQNIEQARENNILAQQQRQSWPMLDNVTGPLHSLYALGLQCRVRAVRIQYFGMEDAESYRQTQCVLKDMRPSTLSISADLSRISVSDIASVVPTSACQYLTHFSFTISFNLSSISATPKSIVENILILLSTLSQLKFLRLTIFWTKEEKSERTDFILLQLKELHEKSSGFLQDIAEITPSLQTIVLCTDTDCQSAWKIRRSGDGVVVSDVIEDVECAAVNSVLSQGYSRRWALDSL